MNGKICKTIVNIILIKLNYGFLNRYWATLQHNMQFNVPGGYQGKRFNNWFKTSEAYLKVLF